MTNNECKLLHLLETVGTSLTDISEFFRINERLTGYERFKLLKTIELFDTIKDFDISDILS